ncbi:LysR family transcriptional regulator [Antarctobacter sp.]|uniref:LysR family transcriptional regulator n=1 Tax=Antarctobacter sp. TaxID=1872577 RepID=UPI003A90C788
MIVTNIGSGLAVNLNLLQVFVSVAECRSFKQASETCGKSHSAVSNGIRQLEEQLQTRLFYRTTRTVDLTDQGRDLLGFARSALTELGDNLHRVHDASRCRSKHISIACSISISGTLLPAVVKKFAARYPEITISVSELPIARTIAGIANGEYDFGIGGVCPGNQALEFEHLIDDPIVALIPNCMAQSRHANITMAELCKLPLVMMTSESITQRMFAAAAKERGIAFGRVYDGALQPSLLLPMVDAGVGATVFPSLGELWASYPNVTAVPIVEPALTRKVSIVTARGARLPEATRHLFPMLRRVARQWGVSRAELNAVA